jgi:hypothetical protein
MTDDPFVALVVEALNLMHPRFAAAGPGARGFRDEFYHQFRRLWDKALPVRLGLGHVMIQSEPDAADAPDFLLWLLGERGESDRRLGVVAVMPAADADVPRLARWAAAHGYPHAVAVLIGWADPVPVAPGAAILVFDTERWSATVRSPGEPAA